MSDLISRSELLTAFNNKNVQITFDLPVEEVLGEDVDLDDFSMLVQDAVQEYRKMVIDTIKNQPTAYSVDEVVEELEETMQDLSVIEILSHIDFDSTIQSGLDTFLKAYNSELLRIVKQGGVSDDVCEWKQDKGCVGLGAYNISCCDKTLEMPVSTARGLKYCTYCGKKIKVVE